MTTAQESPNGHRAVPPPCSFPDSQNQSLSEDSTDNHANSAPPAATSQTTIFPASAYHVPPELYAPKADSFRDTIPEGLTTMKLPDRCQFMFSDGRQCTMARSDIHPSLCTYHSDREEQLFGDPAESLVSSKLDLLELSAACRDLTTAAGVSRALAVVFRLLAQRRISRQEAATFAKLGQLLLQSLSAARADAASADQQRALSVLAPINGQRSALSTYRAASRVNSPRESDNAASIVIPSESAVADERGISPQLSGLSKLQRDPRDVSVPSPLNLESDRGISPASLPKYENSSVWHQPPSTNAQPSVPAADPAPSSKTPSAQTAVKGSSRMMNPSSASACNSGEISTYKNVEVKTSQNQHLHKNDTRLCSSGRTADSVFRRST